MSDAEPVVSTWEVDDCECGWSSGHRDTCLCGSVAADVLGELEPVETPLRAIGDLDDDPDRFRAPGVSGPGLGP